MNLAWLESVKGEERERLREYLVGNQKVLDILVEIVYNKVRETENVSLQDYDSPSWAYKQAHRNGQLDALKWVTKLCDVTTSKK